MVSACLTTVLFTGKAEPADVPTNATPAATKVAITILRMRFSSFAPCGERYRDSGPIMPFAAKPS